MDATSVKKATRVEYAPPKNKHLLALKNRTLDYPASIDSILLNLEKRHNERSWVVTFKVLVVLHYIMREGNCVRAVDGTIKRHGVLDTSKIKNKDSTPANVKNIYMYRAYLDERVVAFRHLRRDYIHEAKIKEGGRLKTLSLSDGLLRETSALQRQLDAALECKFFFQEKDPQVAIFAYKMVLKDTIAVFQSINEGVVNMLDQYFKMSRKDAKQALSIYTKFTQQTGLTIDYLNAARNMELDLDMEVPQIDHAPLILRSSLEAHINNDSSNNTRSTSLPHSSSNSTIATTPQASSSSNSTFAATPQASSSSNSTITATPQPLQMNDYFDVFNTVPPHRQFSLVTDQSVSPSANNNNPFLNQQQGFTTLEQKFNTQPSVVDTNPFRSLSISSESGALSKTNSRSLQPSVYENAFMPITPPLTPGVFTNPFLQHNHVLNRT